MNSMTLPRWFGRRKNKADSGKKSLEVLNSGDFSKDKNLDLCNELNNRRRLPSPTRTSKSTYDLSSTTDRPLATSDLTPTAGPRFKTSAQSSSERNLNQVQFGTPLWHITTHEDILSARQNLRKSLSTTILPPGAQIYENVSTGAGDAESSHYQNVSRPNRSLAASPARARLGGPLGIVDEADEPDSFDRLALFRTSKKLFASQRDMLNYQNVESLNSFLNHGSSLSLSKGSNAHLVVCASSLLTWLPST